MITYKSWCDIQDRAAHKSLPATIAAELGFDVKTVRKWIGRPYAPRLRRKRRSKLDPFKERIAQYLKARPSDAWQVFQRLRRDGFDGGISIVKDYLHTTHPRPRDEFDAHKWILAVLQKEISTDELREQFCEIEEIDTLLNRLDSNRLSERNKSLAVLARCLGVRSKIVCEALGIAHGSCQRYLKTFSEAGSKALFADKRGRKSKCDDEVLKNVIFKVLHEPPSNYGITRTTWTMRLLRKAIGENGMSACPDVVRNIIRAAGYRWRMARVVLTSADPNYSEKLDHIRSVLSNLQPDEAFFSIDEFGPFALRMRGGIKLAAANEQPVVKQWQKSRGSIILTAALELSSNQITFFYSEKKDTDEMIKMMNTLVANYAQCKKLYLSWDAASWHLSKRLMTIIDAHNATATQNGDVVVETAPLPSGAQFLNVIESVFSGMSRAIIHNSDYPSVDNAKEAINRYFSERNSNFLEHPRRAGKKIWGRERELAIFSDSSNCKDPRYR